MVTNDGLLRIFWPNGLSVSASPGVMVGWRNSETDIFIVTILEDVEVCLRRSKNTRQLIVLEKVRNVENALKMGSLYRSSPHPIGRIFSMCGKNAMHVLGTVNHPEPSEIFNQSSLCAFTFATSPLPQIYCPAKTGLSLQVVMFDRPDPVKMQYMSLEPISLALGDRVFEGELGASILENMDVEEERERARIAKLVEKLKLHTVIRHTPSKKERALPLIMNQINCSLEVAELLQKNTPMIGPRRKRSRSVSERVVESAQSLYTYAALFIWHLFLTYIYPIVSKAFLIGLITHRMLAEITLQFLEWRPSQQLPSPSLDSSTPKSFPANHQRPALKDLSAAFQQIHIRLQQFSYYPIQYLLLRRRQRTWSSIPTSHTDYIRFYNSLWLVANDVIIGIALGSYIIDSHQSTASFLSGLLNQYTVSGLERSITWLMGWPAGLKLNGELAEFLGALSLWVIECWNQTITAVITPYLPMIVYFIGFSSFAGASMPIAIVSDLLSLLTLHIYCFYIASARIFNWQLTIIYSLFQLFRGKKRNVLRNRIDSCDYDLDQLLLGTILFTLLFFLLPTVVVFYLTFAFARMSIIVLKAVLDTCLACLNHFPLFALMLRLKDSQRLPGGVHFTLHQGVSPAKFASRTSSSAGIDEDTDTDLSNTGNVSYINLSSTPLSLREIFAQYSHLASRIRKHYISPEVVFRLVTGRFVPPLGRGEMYGLQYSMLPRKRVGVGEVWRGLVEPESKSSNAYGKTAPRN
jgi:phosphatidylinositol N-acetylglucosaminyltransferase subunit Q